MACFVVPMAEAIVTSIAAKAIEGKEVRRGGAERPDVAGDAAPVRVPFSRKVKWLSHLLWGGSALLAFEHVWHGEVVPWYPFLTAAADPGDAAEMLREMATVGVSMALLVTAAWALFLLAVKAWERRGAAAAPRAEEEVRG